MKKALFITLFIFSFFSISFAGDIPQKIVTAFSTGNSSQLSEFFNSSIELTLLEKEEIYSKTQAEMILKDFFAKHPPSKFTIIHKGGKDNSRYAIGDLISGTETYRITFLLKMEGEQVFIHQLRIENDNVE